MFCWTTEVGELPIGKIFFMISVTCVPSSNHLEKGVGNVHLVCVDKIKTAWSEIIDYGIYMYGEFFF